MENSNAIYLVNTCAKDISEISSSTPDDAAAGCVTIEGYSDVEHTEGSVICHVWLTDSGKFIIDWHDGSYRLNTKVLAFIEDAKQTLMNNQEQPAYQKAKDAIDNVLVDANARVKCTDTSTGILLNTIKFMLYDAFSVPKDAYRPAAILGDMAQKSDMPEEKPAPHHEPDDIQLNDGPREEIKLGIDNAIRKATADHPSVNSVYNLEAAAIIADMRSYLYDEFDITDVDD